MDTTQQLYVLALRLTHIYTGVFWAGAALFFAGFLGKAVKAAGPDGGKVMGKLITDTKWSVIIASASGLTVVSGILLYLFRRSAAGGAAFDMSPQGMGFALGGLAGIASFIIGNAVLGRTSKKIAALGAELAKSAGSPPPAEKVAEMGGLQARMERFNNINAILITIAVILMAISRYLG